MDKKNDRCNHCDGGGWMWPNLGVNCPIGSAWAVSVAQAIAMQRGNVYYIRCECCNGDGHKPHPDQGKLDSAAEIDRKARLANLHHAVIFDGTNLIDTWNSKPWRLIKYRYRK